MKASLVYVLLVATVTVTAKRTARTQFEDGLLKMIQKSLAGDVECLPIKLPSLRPLRLPPRQIEHDGYTIDLSELTVNGLEKLTIDKFSASESDRKVTLSFTVPAARARADSYHLQGATLFGMVKIDDWGELQADIDNLRVTADVQFGASGANTVVKKMNINFSVDGVQANLSGSSGIVNLTLNKKISKMIHKRKSTIIQKAKTLIADKLNKALRGYSPEDLINIISGI